MMIWLLDRNDERALFLRQTLYRLRFFSVQIREPECLFPHEEGDADCGVTVLSSDSHREITVFPRLKTVKGERYPDGEAPDVLFVPCPGDYSPDVLGNLSEGDVGWITLTYAGQVSGGFLPVLSLDERLPPAVAVREVQDLLRKKTGARPEEYRLGGLSDHSAEPAPRLDGIPFSVSPTQRMILRYLMRAADAGAPSAELKYFCLKPGNDCTDGNIPAHIGQINRATENRFRTRIIQNVEGRYRLADEKQNRV